MFRAEDPIQFTPRALRHRPLVLQRVPPFAALADETDRRGEDTPAPLPRLDRPRQERAPLTDALHVVHDRDGGVAGEDEVAVETVRVERVVRGGRGGGGNREVGCGEALGDHGATVDAAGAWRVPEFADGSSVSIGWQLGEDSNG